MIGRRYAGRVTSVSLRLHQFGSYGDQALIYSLNFEFRWCTDSFTGELR